MTLRENPTRRGPTTATPVTGSLGKKTCAQPVENHKTMSENETADVCRDYGLGETIPVRKKPGDSPDYELVDEAIEAVANAEGELCIAMKNIGATPWLRPTPYENHRGVLVRMWFCISCYPKAMPGGTLLFGRRVPIWPDEHDHYNVRMFTKEWVRASLRKVTHFEVRPAEESPYCTDWYDWNWENR